MPLYKKLEGAEYSIGVWKTEEGLDFFELLFNGHPEIQNGQKKLQWFASRHLANIMVGQPDIIVKDETGKPNFKTAPLNISLSHTQHFAAVITSKKHAVGIDIETINPKVEKIAFKFLTEQEIANIAAEEKIEKLILYWSAKESLYKFYGWGGVEFKTQLLIEPFILNHSGTLKADIITPHLPVKNLTIQYEFFEGHVLTHVAAL